MLRCSSSQHSCYNKMGEKPVLLGVFIIVVVMGLITNSLASGNIHTCPHSYDGNPNIVLKASPTEFYLPEGFQQVLPCGSWTPGDVLCEVRWIHESRQRVVVIYNLSADTVIADSDYDLAGDFGLLIKSVNPTNAGRYSCYIRDGPENAPLKGALDIHVIGDSFPASSNNMSSSVTVRQGHVMTLPCECARHSANSSILAVYWSIRVGSDFDTNIIAARLANGSLLNSRSNGHNISSDWSLRVDSLNDSSSFWCHVFWSDQTLSNCHAGVRILQDKELNPDPSETPIAIFIAIPIVALIVLIVLCVLFSLLYRKYKGELSFTKCSSSDTISDTKVSRSTRGIPRCVPL